MRRSKALTKASRIQDSESPEVKPSTSANEFAAPSRPSPGELIVPKEPSRTFEPIDYSSRNNRISPIDLRPADLAIYKVERGDTLWGIARKNGVSLAKLLEANPNLESKRTTVHRTGNYDSLEWAQATLGLSETVTSQGDPTLLNQRWPVTTILVEKGDTLSRNRPETGSSLVANYLKRTICQCLLSFVQDRGYRSQMDPPHFAPSQTEDILVPKVVPLGASSHIVQKGENLSRISSIYGVSVGQIMEWNGLSNPSLIRAGQSIIVSQGTSGLKRALHQTNITSDTEVCSCCYRGAVYKISLRIHPIEDRPIIDAP